MAQTCLYNSIFCLSSSFRLFFGVSPFHPNPQFPSGKGGGRDGRLQEFCGFLNEQS